MSTSSGCASSRRVRPSNSASAIAEHAADRGIGGDDAAGLRGGNGQADRAVVEHLAEAALAVAQRVGAVGDGIRELGVGLAERHGLTVAEPGSEGRRATTPSVSAALLPSKSW